MSLLRSLRLTVAWAVLALAAAACSSAQAPAAPTAAPRPTAAAAAAAPSDWNAVVAAARQEGKLVLSTHAGSGYERYVEDVKRALPDLTVEATTIKASDFAARAVVEQQNGQYLWDVHIGPVANVYTVLTPAGALEPIKPYLDALPAEARDDSHWAGGFELFTDPANPVTLITMFSDSHGLYVNREQVPEGLSQPDDLLDPKFKGKIAVYDPTVANGGSMSLAALLALKGDDFLRKLVVDNDARYVSTSRQITEWVAQGRYPIGVGLEATYLTELQQQGVGTQVEQVRSPAFGTYSIAFGVSVLKNAPHPNATKLFLSWALSREGQTAWAQDSAVDASSRRLDVPVFHPDLTPDYQHMENYKVIQGTASGEEMLRRTLAITKDH
jgi:iron(III) transport system substrate-binding protein